MVEPLDETQGQFRFNKSCPSERFTAVVWVEGAKAGRRKIAAMEAALWMRTRQRQSLRPHGVQPQRPRSNGEPELCGCDDEEDEDMFGEEDDHHDDAARSLKFHQRLPRDVLRHAQCHGKEALQRNTVGRGKQELVSGMRAGCSLYFPLILFSRMRRQRQNKT